MNIILSLFYNQNHTLYNLLYLFCNFLSMKLTIIVTEIEFNNCYDYNDTNFYLWTFLLKKV